MPSRALVAVTVGRTTHDADSRIARIVLWLLANQRALLDGESNKLVINRKGDSIKPSLERFYGEIADEVA